MSDKKFAKGFFFNRSEKAPSYVIGGLSINENEAIDFIRANSKGGKLRLSILNSKGGKPYMVVDEYEPKSNNIAQEAATEEDLDGLPF